MAINAGAIDNNLKDDLRSRIFFLGSWFGALYDSLEDYQYPFGVNNDHFIKVITVSDYFSLIHLVQKCLSIKVKLFKCKVAFATKFYIGVST